MQLKPFKKYIFDVVKEAHRLQKRDIAGRTTTINKWILRSKFTTISAQSLPLVWSCCSGINLVVFSGPQ